MFHFKVVVFRTKSLVFLDGSRGKASLEERLLHFKVLAFWAKCLGASGYSMEKFMDVSRGTPLENNH